VNGITAVLVTYLRWAHKQGLLATEPYRDLRKLAEPRDPAGKAWWTADLVELALRCAAEVDRDLAYRTHGDQLNCTAQFLVGFGCLAGMRWEEIIMLRWQDLDLDARNPTTGEASPVIRVVAHDGGQPKDGDARTIPIHERLMALLLAARKTEGYVLAAKKRVSTRGGTRPGYRYDPGAVWTRIIAKVVAAGGKAISPHGMRHSFASNLLIAGESDVKVARWLGHADTSLVHERYGHLLSYDGGINRVRLGGDQTPTRPQ
jgi:integrase